ncbi:MAG: hypothetical protein OXE75_16220 [bacterium]|nr:hypothetical protein [bacterium]
MSADLLAHLAGRYAFDGTPMPHDLGAYHVPFDLMLGRDHVEARLQSAAVGGERVALIADSGTGKSSVVRYVLGPDAPDVAPVLVPVNALGEGAGTPDRVADEILALFGRYARQVTTEAVTGSSRRVTEARRQSDGIGLDLHWLRVGRAKEVERQTATDSLITLREKSEAIDLTLRGIPQDGLQPVVVFDDSDRWLAGGGREMVPQFFREVVRWLTDFPTSVVVATHTRYLEPDGGRAANLLEFLDTRIEVPRVPSADMLGRVLERRITRNTEETPHSDAVLSDVVSDQAIEALFDHYSQNVPLRRALQTAHIALADAVSAGAQTIDASHITAAQQA